MRLILPLLLFAAVEAIFFQFPPLAKECFLLDATKGEDIAGSYEVNPKDKKVDVSLHYFRRSTPVYLFQDRNQNQGAFEHQASHDTEGIATYYLCFKSTVNLWSTVNFNIRMHQHTNPDTATSDQAQRIQQVVEQMEEKAFELESQQQYAISRESERRNTSESTNARVLWWNVCQIVVLVFFCSFQVLYIRRLFDVTKYLV